MGFLSRLRTCTIVYHSCSEPTPPVCYKNMHLSPTTIEDFREAVWQHYRSAGRSMPWRNNPEPYWVIVSEIMLQQTQVDRVRPKFQAFIEAFPTIAILARAPLARVLELWSGLGYNRRAKFLWLAAQKVVAEYGGVLPQTVKELTMLPGIGENTAGAIMAYAYNQPVVFVETNVRTVYFHHFFTMASEVTDKELREVVAATLDSEHPREWYWALMDYGSHLKKTAGGRLSQSRHYKKQSPLKGSLREMRGRIVKSLTKGPLDTEALRSSVLADDRFEPALQNLLAEGMLERRGDKVSLTDHSVTHHNID